MKTYKYKYLVMGIEKVGYIESENMQDAIIHLENVGIYPFNIQEVKQENLEPSQTTMSYKKRGYLK